MELDLFLVVILQTCQVLQHLSMSQIKIYHACLLNPSVWFQHKYLNVGLPGSYYETMVKMYIFKLHKFIDMGYFCSKTKNPF